MTTAYLLGTPRIGGLDDYTRCNPSETPPGSCAISFPCRVHLPRFFRCRTWDRLRGVAARHPVSARGFHCLVARHGVVYALGVPRGSAWRFAKKRVLALRVKPRRQLL